MIIEATLYVTNNRYLDINPPKKKLFKADVQILLKR